MKNFLIFFFLGLYSNLCNSQSLITYPSPESGFSKISDKYVINLLEGGVVKRSFVYKTTAGNGVRREWGGEQNNSFHFTTFSFSGTVSVEVIKLNSSASSAIIRPNRLGIGTKTTISQGSNRKIKFTLTRFARVSVEFNDDPLFKDALIIFADDLEKGENIPNRFSADVFVARDSASLNNIPSTKTIVYFKPGIYKTGRRDIPAFIKQVYIAGGAYIQGYLYSSGNSIKINGRGIISNAGYPYHYPSKLGMNDDNSSQWYNPINISRGQNNLIEGITIIEATAFNIKMSANNSIIRNVNINGFRWNNDGITIMGNGNLIDQCFIRTNDDAITVYSSALTIKNCVFSPLQGSVIQLGWTPHSIKDISVSNCDIIHDKASGSENNVGFINAMNSRKSNQIAVINGVNVSDIYFDTPVLRFVDIRGDRNNQSPFGTSNLIWVYKNFHFNNIHFNQLRGSFPLIYLHGYSDDHPLSNFIFQNIYINEKKVSAAKLGDGTFISVKNADNVVIN